jgi:hypothetical protein
MIAARRGQKGFPNCDGHRETSPVRPPGRPSPHSTIPASAPERATCVRLNAERDGRQDGA